MAKIKIIELIKRLIMKKRSKVAKIMEEFEEHKLHSGSKKGPIVKKKAQAIAIGLSEARKAGEKVKKKK